MKKSVMKRPLSRDTTSDWSSEWFLMCGKMNASAIFQMPRQIQTLEETMTNCVKRQSSTNGIRRLCCVNRDKIIIRLFTVMQRTQLDDCLYASLCPSVCASLSVYTSLSVCASVFLSLPVPLCLSLPLSLSVCLCLFVCLCL